MRYSKNQASRTSWNMTFEKFKTYFSGNFDKFEVLVFAEFEPQFDYVDVKSQANS